MENEELKNKLIKKLERELTDFKDSLKGLPAEQIIDNSYKITCMQTIQDYLAYDKDYSKFELKTLLKREHILQECYDDCLSNDGSLREALEFTLEIMRSKKSEIKMQDKKKEVQNYA